MSGIKLQNWKRNITYYSDSVHVVENVDDIVRIIKDKEKYPSPVRAKGSHHSTTRCIVASHGTVIDLHKLNKIIEINKENRTITMQAGVLHIDAAYELEKQGLQFYVNVEIGNLTVGSGATCATKDASFYTPDSGGFEFGQVNSYVIGMKLVLPNGELLEVTEADGELLEVMRSSYGMLGIVYEVTYRVKPIKPMAMQHIRYHVDEFANRLEELVAGNRSMMLYLFPFQDAVVVEYRWDGEAPLRPRSWQWKLRDWVWETGSPLVGKLLTSLVPIRGIRSFLIDIYNSISQFALTRIIHANDTSPADQIIRYPETAGFASYTFSIWAFPRETFPTAIRDYFEFCKEYYRLNGYRCDMLNVGYHIIQDKQSLFSYTRNGPVLTLDPVSTGSKGWEGFLIAYNEFCIQHNGKPLLNQTPSITPLQAKAAFGAEIEKFQEYRHKYDPDDRCYNQFFRNLFE